MPPKGWSVRSLGAVLERVAVPVSLDPMQHYREIGIRSHGKGIFHKDAVLGMELGDKRVFEVMPECLVLNIVFAWEQAIARTSLAEMGMIASHRFPMYKPKGESCDIDYLNYYFKSKRGKSLLELASPGGAGRNRTLGQSEFLKLNMTMPPAPEQRRIADAISVWDQAIQTVDKLVANSAMNRLALSQQLLRGHVRLNKFSGHVQRRQIKDIAFVDQLTLGSDTSPDRTFRYVSLSDVNDGKISSNLPIIRFGEAPSRARRLLRTSDVLMATVRPGLKTIAHVDAEFDGSVASTGFAVLSPRDNVSSRFLFHCLFSREVSDQVNSVVVGSNYPAINSSDVEKLTVRWPDLAEQVAIADVLDVAEIMQIRYVALRHRIASEKSALMQQLLTGRRRLRLEVES